MREKLFLDNWIALSQDEKTSIMQEIINEKNLSMEIKSIETFGNNNIETVLFEKTCVNPDEKPKKFVFVPGKKQVVLGWDSKTCKLENEIIEFMEKQFLGKYEYLIEDIKENIEYVEERIEEAKQKGDKVEIEVELEILELELAEYREYEKEPESLETIQEWIKHLDENTSPIRTVDISPMIVEVYPRPTENINKELGEIFSFPTEDEWEYMYGGGSQSLFPWNAEHLNIALDVPEYINVRHTKDDERTARINKFALGWNIFGLYFDLDTYTGELVSSECFSKGSDGGSSICGGDGSFYVAPVISTFYSRDKHVEGYMEMIKNRKIPENRCLYRRIVRL